jgi:hypothetical protein
MSTARKLPRPLSRLVWRGCIDVLRYELANARTNLKFHEDDAARPYWLGVRDGLVLAMGILHIPTEPKNRRIRGATNP